MPTNGKTDLESTKGKQGRVILMKKFWIYLAMPVALLNGCHRQQAALDNAGSLAAGSGEESAAAEGEMTDSSREISMESKEDETESSTQETAEPALPTVLSSQEETWDDSALQGNAGKPASVIASQNSIKEAVFEGSTVSIARSEKQEASQITETEIEAMVREAAWDLDTVVKNGQTVVLKPNLVQMIVDSTGEKLEQEVNGVTTDWRVAKAVLKMVRELNPDGKVYIMEGSATGPTRDVMEYFHYTDEYLEDVDGFICLEEDCGAWQDFDAEEVVKVELPDGLLHKSYYFNKVLYEADVIISIPALKTSSGVVVTGGIKNVSIGTPPGNLYGTGPKTPSKQKMVSHKITDGELDKWIYDYYKAKPVSYVIVDGLQGFQSGPVPMSAERKETDKMNMRMVLAGKDAVAVDTVCCLLMGWDPESVGYLNLFRERDGLGDTASIRLKGAFMDDIRTHFTIYKENLGGKPVTEHMGPEFSGNAVTDGDSMVIRYKAGEGTKKVEVYIDGIFQTAQKVEEGEERGTIRLTMPGLHLAEHKVSVAAFDRFFNRTVKGGLEGNLEEDNFMGGEEFP